MDINQRGSILNEMSSSPALATVLVAAGRCWTNHFATVFRLCRIARSSTTVFTDLLLACYLANANCAVMNIMTALIFIIVSWLHAFFLVVPVRLADAACAVANIMTALIFIIVSRSHAFFLVVVIRWCLRANCCFQHTPPQSHGFNHKLSTLRTVVLKWSRGVIVQKGQMMKHYQQ